MQLLFSFLLKGLLLLNGKPLSNQAIVLVNQTTNRAIETVMTDQNGQARFSFKAGANDRLALAVRISNDTLAVLQYYEIAAFKDSSELTMNVDSKTLQEIRIAVKSSGNCAVRPTIRLHTDSLPGVAHALCWAFSEQPGGNPSVSPFAYLLAKTDSLYLKVSPGQYRITGNATDYKNEKNMHRTKADCIVTSALFRTSSLPGNKYGGFRFNPAVNDRLVLMLEEVH